MGHRAPGLDPLSVVGATGIGSHVKALLQNSFQPHGPLRKLRTLPVCAENPVQAVTQAAPWGEGGISLRCAENLTTG